MFPSASVWERLEYVLTDEGTSRNLMRFRSFISRAFFGSVDSLHKRLQWLATSRNTMLRALYSFLEFLAGTILFLLYYVFVFLLGAGSADPYPDTYPEKKK